MCALQITPRIETDRLVLRAPRPEDAWRIADLINDYDIARMTTRIPHPYSLGDAQAYLKLATRAGAGGDLPLVIEHRTFGLIGCMSLDRDEGRPFAELGYWLGRTFWNRGFATEAATAALGWVHSALGRRVIMAGHYSDNPASGRVLEKAGFLYTGDVELRRSLARGEIAPTRMMVWLA